MLVPLPKTRDVAPVRPRNLVLLGSTGSIGRSALEVLRNHKEQFRVLGLVGNKNLELLCAQIEEFKPRFAGCSDDCVDQLRAKMTSSDTKILSLKEALVALPAHQDADLVLAAMVGVVGLNPVLRALRNGKTVALANKESLVAGGALVRDALSNGKGKLIPVDSEHSAIFQALQGERALDISRLILTASGGPFLDTPVDGFSKITPAQAIKHPRWNMGAKISIDSATLMNKALELIEAHWLFGIPEDRIEVLIHPQSIVHSMIEFVDGTLLAQASVPDMRGPIAYAFNYPHGRLDKIMQRVDFAKVGTLDFRELDSAKFPSIRLAREALRAGGGACAVLNIANEAAVKAFMDGKIGFDKIVPSVERALARFSGRNFQTLLELEHLTFEVLPSVAP